MRTRVTEPSGLFRDWSGALGRLVSLLLLLWAAPELLAQPAVAPSSTQGGAAGTLDWEIEVGGGHRGAVTRGVFTPDAARIVTIAQDGMVKTWEVATGRMISSWDAGTPLLSSLALSPSGERLAVGAMDGSIQLRNATSGRMIISIKAHQGEVGSVAFSPDGKQLASAGSDSKVRLWSIPTGKEVRTLSGPVRTLNAVLFSPDGKTLLAAGAEGRIFRWTVATGGELPGLTAGDSPITSLAISANGKFVAAGSWDMMARVWDTRSGRFIRSFAAHKNWVTDVEFSPDGDYLFTSSRDRDAALWNFKSQKPSLLFRGHLGAVSSAKLSPDGASLLTTSWDGTARVWSSGLESSPLPGGTLLMVLRGHSVPVTSMVWAPDGRSIASGYGDGAVWVWDARSGRITQSFRSGWSPVTALAWSKTGSLAAGFEDGSVTLWPTDGTARRRSVQAHQARIVELDFSPEGDMVAAGSADKTVSLWRVIDADRIRVHKLKGEVTGVRFVEAGHTLIFSTALGELGGLNVETGVVDKPLQRQGESIRTLSVVNSSGLLAAGTADGVVKLWSLQDRKSVLDVRGHAGPVHSLSFSPDGRRLASTGQDLLLKLWDVRSGEALLKKSRIPMLQVRWSPDGQVVAASAEGLQLLRPAQGDELATFHRLGELALRTTQQGHFSGPEVLAKDVYYRRYERVRSGYDSLSCYLPDGFNPLAPPSRSTSCANQLHGRPLDKMDALSLPLEAPARIRLVAAGISSFQNHSEQRPLNLKYAARDVRRVTDQLKRQFGRNLVIQGERPLLNQEATRARLLAILEKAMAESNGHPEELVLIYLSGRSLNDGVDLTFLPWDFDPESPILSSLSQTRLAELLGRSDARVLLVLDAGQPPPVQPVSEDRTRLLTRLVQSRQRTWAILSSKSEERFESNRFCSWGGSAFTCTWLDAWRGRAYQTPDGDQGDSTLTIEELFSYLERSVPRLLQTQGAPEQRQIPVMIRYGGRLTLQRK